MSKNYSNNYSKWDKLEVSDDSDIEGHPNVDHKSLVRWKQRDIHEKREARKHKIATLRGNIDVNVVLFPRLETVIHDVREGGPPVFSSIVERLKTQPSPDKPNTGDPDQLTYDAMVEGFLVKAWETVKGKGVDKDDDKLGDELVQELETMFAEAKKVDEQYHTELDEELKEQAKHITMEDIHDGFDSHYVPSKPEPASLVPPKKKKETKKVTTTEYEVLNPKAAGEAKATEPGPGPEPTPTDDGTDIESDDEDLPQLTDSLREFAKIAIGDYEASYRFIQAHRDVVVEGATDALLVEAFSAQSRGQKKYAKQCVQQSLLLQYCDRLGRDGVQVFFKRMISGHPTARDVFVNDLEGTYKHLAQRVAKSKAEEAEIAAKGGQETIQLVAEDPTQQITFNVPGGPPPAELRLEGPGTEDLDIEQVRKMLQMRWEVFDGFDLRLQSALKKNSLDAVNKVLARMPIHDAENTVQLLEMTGILNFADGGKIRDETGRSAPDVAADAEPAAEA